MNNEAFRTLVNSQNQRNSKNNNNASEKSTKEISREAVEHEFKKCKLGRRNRGGGGRSGGGRSDGGSSSNDEEHALKKQQPQRLASNDSEPEWKRRRREKRTKDGGGGTNEDTLSVEYRDRAKERRMGNNYLDYDDATLQGLAVATPSLLAGGGQGKSKEEMILQDEYHYRRKRAELSKYLGGDLEHTHLVKGLDKALAEKVRREEMMMVGLPKPSSKKEEANDDDDDDLDRVLEDARLKKEQESQLQGAEKEDWKLLLPKTELGKSILSYLLRKQVSSSTSSSSSGTTTLLASIPAPVPTSNISAVQKSIRLSVLAFSLESDVRQRHKAWEVPHVSMKAFGAHSSEASTTRWMAPLNNHMIAAISKKLDGRGGASSRPNRSKYYCSSSPVKRNRHENEIDESAIAKSARSTTSGVSSIKRKAENDDSDDDIFSNVGNYYLPPQAVSSSAFSTSPSSKGDANGDTTKKEEARKQSIFENLIPEMNSSTMALKQPAKRVYIMQQNPRNQSDLSGNRNVIDRDIFGGGEDQSNISSSQLLHQRRRGPLSAAMDGVSVAAYQGGYGEEMDVDFGGNDDDEEEDGLEKSDKWRRGKTCDKKNGGSIRDNASDDLVID